MVEQPPLLTVYLISAEPTDTPLTNPPEFTLAIPGALLDHTPPAVAEVYVTLEPTQTEATPVTAATVGAAFTVITLILTLEQPLEVTVYIISTEPADTPLTKPFELTLAILGSLLDHTPPVVADVYVVDAPTQTDVAPVIAATVGSAFTRMDFVVVLTFPLLYAFNVIMYEPGVLNVAVTFVAIDVDGMPPGIVHLTESTEPEEAVEVLVKLRLFPEHTVVSLAVKLAVGVGVEVFTPYRLILST